jgi:hypothetical protein
MTDELAGGAPASVEPTAVAETSVPSNQPEPITEATPRNAIDRAFDAVEKADTVPATEKPAQAAPVAEGDRPRNADGTFKANDGVATPQTPKDGVPATPAAVDPTKPATSHADAPARFASDPEAKAAWAATPEPVKAATTRAIAELEKGVTQYKNAYAPFHPFVDLAQKNNVHPVEQLKSYVGIDMLLTQDFDAGVAQIFQNKGVSLKEWAAKIAGTPVDQNALAQDQTITELRTKIANLERGYQGVSQTIEQQRGAQVSQSLDGFMASLPDTEKALFQELDGEIARYLADPSTTLSDAFASAKRDAQARYQRMFGNAPASDAGTQAAAAQTREPAPVPQTRNNGQLQVSGAPGSGSTPASRGKPPSSPREAIDGAFASLGL